MTLRDDLLPVLDALRAIPGELGFRLHRVFIVRKSQSDWELGLDAVETTVTELTVQDGYAPKVEVVSTSDYKRGAPADAELKVEVTPAFDTGSQTGGYTSQDLDALTDGDGIYFRVEGPGMPEGGGLFVRTGLLPKSLAWELYLTRVSDIGGR